MFQQTTFASLCSVQHPIVLAPMAGGVTTPELVAAVSNAGGLGSLGAGYLSPAKLREEIKEIRMRTSRPFAVNLFVPGNDNSPDNNVCTELKTGLKPICDELGIEPEELTCAYEDQFEEQFAVIIEERVPVFSFTFGMLAKEKIQKCKQAGILTIGTATTVLEAIRLEGSGVDAIVTQGSEAGGHRGTFAHPYHEALIGTMALVPQVADHVSIPIIAAGGIMDARGIVASFALGASAAQMGTAFIPCKESGAHPLYKDALLRASEDRTAVSQAIKGKAVRGLHNRLMDLVEQMPTTLPYPYQHALTQKIRQAAAQQQRPEWMSMWAGQGIRLAKETTVQDFMTEITEGIGKLLGRLNEIDNRQ
ncbi:NAD(P)H-dependent flavin oxidoreductase [Laceyella putida]|uniref:Probable nitronate monooxygenase n=1 Tax=Laceyella putida TaxID=110101 RepID=A0ABW2RNU5_9BACL